MVRAGAKLEPLPSPAAAPAATPPIPPPVPTKKKRSCGLWLAIFVLILAILGGSVYFYWKSKNSTATPAAPTPATTITPDATDKSTSTSSTASGSSSASNQAVPFSTTSPINNYSTSANATGAVLTFKPDTGVVAVSASGTQTLAAASTALSFSVDSPGKSAVIKINGSSLTAALNAADATTSNWLIDLASGQAKSVPSTYQNGALAPGGTKLAWLETTAGKKYLTVTDLAFSNAKRVGEIDQAANVDLSNLAIRWLGEESVIYYLPPAAGVGTDLTAVNTKTGTVTQLTSSHKVIEAVPAPDGKTIALTYLVGTSFRLALLDAATRQVSGFNNITAQAGSGGWKSDSLTFATIDQSGNVWQITTTHQATQPSLAFDLKPATLKQILYGASDQLLGLTTSYALGHFTSQ